MSDASETLLAREENTVFRHRLRQMDETLDRTGRRASVDVEADADALAALQHHRAERMREEQRTGHVVNDDDGERVPDLGRDFTTTSTLRKYRASEADSEAKRERTHARKKSSSEERRSAARTVENGRKFIETVARSHPDIDLPPAEVAPKINRDWDAIVAEIDAVESSEDDMDTALAGVERQIDDKIKEVTGRGFTRHIPGKVRRARGASYRPFVMRWGEEPIPALATREGTPTVNSGLPLTLLFERDKALALAREEVVFHYKTLDRDVLVMTPEARESALARLRKELMTTETALAAEIWENAGEDGDVFFNPKWHPAAILGIDLEALRLR